MHTPGMLRDFIEQYQENRITAIKQESQCQNLDHSLTVS